MTEIKVTSVGQGPDLLLVHGGAGPGRTWQPLMGLASSWTLRLVHRRGYPPSPPGRHDFELDATDLAPLLESRPHVLAHSYGALGALTAAARNPGKVRSLTLIEPPLFFVAEGDPEVQRMERMANRVLTDGLEADPASLREFLRLAGALAVPNGPLPDKLVQTIARAHCGRLPGEAHPPLQALRKAGVPSLVASGGHSDPLERICDALATKLGGERLVLAGAGHFLQASPAFSEHLERHLSSAE